MWSLSIAIAWGVCVISLEGEGVRYSSYRVNLWGYEVSQYSVSLGGGQKFALGVSEHVLPLLAT